MGERTSMYRDDRRGQRLYGFSPTPAEVRSLTAFGDVTYAADLVSTKVCIRNVARENLRRLARRPFVVEVSATAGPIEPNSLSSNDDLASVDASEILTDSWTSFNSAYGNYTAYTISIGVVGAGYDTSYQAYSSNHAEDIGVDGSLSKDFTDESDPFNDTAWNGHTAEVADTAAYMLKGGDTHSDQFVSLKIISDGQDATETEESIRNSIEYATKNGIDVLNMSFGGKSYNDCPSHYCSELNSYATGGGVTVAAVDNADRTSKAEYPACSWHTVGVGGVNRKDGSGNAVTVPDTEFSEIVFNKRDYPAFCSWCYEESGRRRGFTPEVYGVSVIDTSNYSEPLDGTSFACPQVAASAWIDFADGGIGSYSEALDRFGNMDSTTVVSANDSKDPSTEGNLLWVDDYF